MHQDSNASLTHRAHVFVVGNLLDPSGNVAVAGRLHHDYFVPTEADQVSDAEKVAPLLGEVIPRFHYEAGISALSH